MSVRPESGTLGEGVSREDLLKALKRAERACEAARTDKLRFLTAVDHEFRTAMNGVTAVAELLSRQALPAEADALVKTLAGSASRVQRLIEAAVELGRGSDADMALDVRPFSSSELLDAVETTARADAELSGMRLVLSHDGDADVRLSGDAARLAQVMSGFVEHAAARSGGRLVEASLSVRPSDDGAILQCRVRDSGEPLPEERLAYMFDPTADLASQGCAGLRLALCRRFMDAMHGAIWAESNTGQGVTLGFDVRLDYAEEAVSAPEAAFAARAPRVLIVDDNATNRLVATAFCELAGCVCESAEDGLEALEAVKARAFDVVLMDIRMPRMDGLAAARAIRALPGEQRSVPILALTADADPESARSFRAAGMQNVIEKPIKPERLLSALQAALQSGDPAADEAAAA